MARPSPLPRLKVSNLGPIESADVEFGDLTVLVGPQKRYQAGMALD